MITDIVSYGGNTFGANYRAGFMPGTQPSFSPYKIESLERTGTSPSISALNQTQNRMALMIVINDTANVNTLRSQLFRWFDPEDRTSKQLVANSTSGSTMYVYAIVESLVPYSTPAYENAFAVNLIVDGDGRWRNTNETSEAWAITASGQTHTFSNAGEDDVSPVYTFKPTSAKAGGYAYRQFIPVKWMSSYGSSTYPHCHTMATNALVGAGKMQADGDDLRVYVDGKEVYRWLDSMNSAATKIWFYTIYVPAPLLTLKTAIAATGDLDSIALNQDIKQLPESGILYIDTEIFVYSSRNLIDKTVTGITRGAKGSGKGAHALAARVHWLQHDVTIVYGNAASTAPVVDDNYKPCMELDHSTNTSWVYEVFGNYAFQDWGDTIKFEGEHRPGKWEKSGPDAISGDGGVYTATHRLNANPYSVAGIWFATTPGSRKQAYAWTLSNPCGITNVTFTNGQKRSPVPTAGDAVSWYARLNYLPRGNTAFERLYNIPSPVVANAWESWSYSGSPAFATSNAISMAMYWFSGDLEVGDVTATLNSLETPIFASGSEQGNYHLQGTLTNQTTSESITLDFVMDVNSELEVDTDNKTVTWLKDGSRQLQSLTLSQSRTGKGKRDWLRLSPGNNVLRFDDTNSGSVTLSVAYNARYY